MRPGDLVRVKWKGKRGSFRHPDQLVVCLDPQVRREHFWGHWEPTVCMLTLGGDMRNFSLEYYDFEVVNESR